MRANFSRQVFSVAITVAAVLLLDAGVQADVGIGWFTGGNVGSSEFGDYELEAESTRIDDGSTGFMLFGGYRVHRYFAAGAAYVDLGDLNADGSAFGGFTDRLEADGFNVYAMGIFPVSPDFAVYGSVGAFRWDQTVTYSDSFEDFRGTASGTDPSFGAGVIWDILADSGWHVQAGWQQFKDVGDLDETGHENDIDLIMVGASYLFGR